MPFCLSTPLSQPFDRAVEAVRAALAEEGFGVLTEIDVAATLKKKLGVERPPYLILGACNPGLANQALQCDPDVGVLLPCSVVVRADDAGAVNVAAVDPVATLGGTGNAGLAGVAAQVREKLGRVVARLGATSA
jgi:uncharacterized protein (DUF302 family)